MSGEAVRAPLSVWDRVKILVVDDDACNQMVAEALLNALGYYDVAIANNGVEALRALPPTVQGTPGGLMIPGAAHEA